MVVGKLASLVDPPRHILAANNLMRKVLLTSITLLLFFSFTGISFANKKEEISQCHAHIKPLHLKRERVTQLDGIWGLFEKTRELQGNSVIAINLDRKVNSIIFHLEYLCDTLNGIPMNEVARYVRDGINNKGEEEFRKELIILGKSEADIDIWFEFSRFSISNENRLLNFRTIVDSIKKSAPYIDTYVALAEKIDRREIDDSIIKNVSELSSKIDNFFKLDRYLNQAITENTNIPYVDINESSGGS